LLGASTHLRISRVQTETYALLQGLKITISLRIQKLIVVGDSKKVNRHMVLNTTPVDTLLTSVTEWTKQASKSFSSVHFYHVLRENNILADSFANQATSIKVGDIVINGKIYTQPIP
jgi:ribonuclease HI